MSLEKMFSESKDRARVEGIYWAGVIIWAGLVFAASSLSMLPVVGRADVWTWVIFGAGVYGTLMNLFYYSSSEPIKPRTWDWCWSAFWLVIGFGGFFAIDIFWPLALVTFGVLALVTALQKN